MPDKKGRLTPQERIFVDRFAATGDQTYAATKAGYAQPIVRGSIKAADPTIQAEVVRQQRARINCEALPIAVQTLIDNMTNTAAPFSARNVAAGMILKYAFGDEAGSQGKAPHEMTSGELAKAIADARLRAAALEHTAADRARPILEHETKPDLFG